MNWMAYCYDSNYKATQFDESILLELSNNNLRKEEREELEQKLNDMEKKDLENKKN